jgi:hypothetical protein
LREGRATDRVGRSAVLELRAAGESAWSVRFGQRVPRGAESLVVPGCELQVAFSAVGEDEAVAVDWPATSGGLHR